VPDSFGTIDSTRGFRTALSQDGATIREIAEEMGASPESIHRILKGRHRLAGDAILV
jgi:predicted transcriptional regulator